jgi:hypothetical protein
MLRKNESRNLARKKIGLFSRDFFLKILVNGLLSYFAISLESDYVHGTFSRLMLTDNMPMGLTSIVLLTKFTFIISISS